MLNFDYITLDLGESRLSFRITNLFPNHSQACAGSFFIQSGLFFQVFQARLLLFMSPFGLLWHMPQSFALSSGFYCVCAYFPQHHLGFYSRGLSPVLFILPPHSPGEWTGPTTPRLESQSFLPTHHNVAGGQGIRGAVVRGRWDGRKQ